MHRIRNAFVAFAAWAALWTAAPASAQLANYPARTITIVVPFAAGGPTDIIARIVSNALAQSLKANVIVDNRAGGGGNIGITYVARSAPDGHTLLLTSTAIAVNPALFDNLPYDPFKDFAPISELVNAPNVLFVRPDSGINSIADLVARAKAEPDKFNYSSPGVGTKSHLSGELFRLTLNLDLPSIPFSGGGPMIQSVVAGHTPVAFSSMPPAAAQIQAGTLRALAVTGEKRIDSLPDVPTMIEAGYPGQTGETPVGIFVQTGTPKEVGDIIRAKVVKIIAMPDVKAKLASVGFVPIGDTPEEFTAYLKAEGEKWGKVIRDGKITIGQ